MRALLRFAVLTALMPMLAYAPTSRADGEDAAALLLRGYALRREHRNEEALAVYAQAFALSPTPAVRAQKALAEQTLGHWLDAERDLDLSLATGDPWVERNRTSLEDARAVVRQHLAWLTVDVDVDGARILLDGEPLSQGREARVVAGMGVLEVRGPGRVPDIRRVSLAPSEHVHQRISLEPFLPASPPPVDSSPATTVPEPGPLPSEVVAPPPPQARPAAPIVPLTLGALGIAGIATGTYFAFRTAQDKSNERAHCVGHCTPEAARDYSDAQTSAAVSTVAFGAGIAFVAGGAVLWFLGRGKAHGATSTLRVVPAIGVGMSGLVVHGSL
jgi:hypothetical protein